jgi:hypothetical protein
MKGQSDGRLEGLDIEGRLIEVEAWENGTLAKDNLSN